MSQAILIDNRPQKVMGSLAVPSPQSPYFGWLDTSQGFNTIRIDNVVAIAPSQRQDLMNVYMSTGQAMAIPVEDGLRLMKRMGGIRVRL